jgi:hypothetical protein
MGATELQRNWQDMRKTLGKPGFCSGEDRNLTTRGIAAKTRHLRSCGAESGAPDKTSGNVDRAKRLITDPDLEFIMKAWPLLEPQAKSQMMEIAQAAGWER